MLSRSGLSNSSARDAEPPEEPGRLERHHVSRSRSSSKYTEKAEFNFLANFNATILSRGARPSKHELMCSILKNSPITHQSMGPQAAPDELDTVHACVGARSKRLSA